MDKWLQFLNFKNIQKNLAHVIQNFYEPYLHSFTICFLSSERYVDVGCSINFIFRLHKVSLNFFCNHAINQNILHAELEDHITTLRNGDFSNCLVMETITLPEKLNVIGGSCFRDCSKLKMIKKYPIVYISLEVQHLLTVEIWYMSIFLKN